MKNNNTNELTNQTNNIINTAIEELNAFYSFARRITDTSCNDIGIAARLNNITLLHQTQSGNSLRMVSSLYHKLINETQSVDYCNNQEYIERCIYIMQTLDTFYQSVLPNYIVKLQQHIETSLQEYRKISIEFISQIEILKNQLSNFNK